MADIFHYFIINAPVERVFQSFTTSKGLDSWWTKKSSGKAVVGKEYTLGFSPNYIWKGVVTKTRNNKEFEIQITQAQNDWNDTRVGVILKDYGEATRVHFYHKGWSIANEHYKISTYCWAMYLRVLKRHLEYNEDVPYEDRLKV